MYISQLAETVAEENPLNLQEVLKDQNSFNTFVSDVWTNFLAFIPTLIVAIVVLIVGLLLTKLFLTIIGKAFKKSKVDVTIRSFMHSLLKIALYLLLFTIVLTILGVPTTSLIAVIGTAGVAIGLALQGSLSNVAGGFLILISKPFKIGDYIEIAGVQGTVEKINILFTKINTADNKAVFVPNGTASGAIVQNYSGNELRRVDMVFTISYESDYYEAVEAVKKVLAYQNEVVEEPAYFIGMLEHSASSVKIAVRPWCKTADYWTVYFNVTEGIKATFDASGISIPYDQLDVHIVEQDKK